MGTLFLVGDKVEFIWGSTPLKVVATQGNSVWVKPEGGGDPYTAKRENLQAYVPPKPKVGEVWHYRSQMGTPDGFRIIGVDEAAGIYWMVQEDSFSPTNTKTVTYDTVKPYGTVPDNEVAHKFSYVWKRPLNFIPSHFVKKGDA